MKYKFSIFLLATASALNACGEPATTAASSDTPIGECSGMSGIQIVDNSSWTKAARAGQPVSSAYVAFCNASNEDDAIVSATYGGAKAVEIHRSAMTEGVMAMKKLEQLALPAGKKTSMEPGGTHLMMIGIIDSIEPGQPINIRFEFEKAAPVEVAFDVRDSDRAHGHEGH